MGVAVELMEELRGPLMHQQHPSILTERSGRVASELGTELRAHPVPSLLLHNRFGDFEHPKVRRYDKPHTQFRVDMAGVLPRGAAYSNGFEPLLRVCHTPSEINDMRQQYGL